MGLIKIKSFNTTVFLMLAPTDKTPATGAKSSTTKPRTTIERISRGFESRQRFTLFHWAR